VLSFGRPGWKTPWGMEELPSKSQDRTLLSQKKTFSGAPPSAENCAGVERKFLNFAHRPPRHDGAGGCDLQAPEGHFTDLAPQTDRDYAQRGTRVKVKSEHFVVVWIRLLATRRMAGDASVELVRRRVHRRDLPRAHGGGADGQPAVGVRSAP
jgi:hypothetical protein